MDATIIWDLEDDSDGNLQHLREHDVTIEEAEEVLLNPQSSRAVSRTSGPLTLRPITAYDVPPPAPKKKRRKR